MSFDELQDKIISLKNPTVAGLDPRPDFVPDHIMKKASRRKKAKRFRRPPTRILNSTAA